MHGKDDYLFLFLRSQFPIECDVLFIDRRHIDCRGAIGKHLHIECKRIVIASGTKLYLSGSFLIKRTLLIGN